MQINFKFEQHYNISTCSFCFQLLDAFGEFGVNLEEFLHVLLPHITSLFDGAEIPIKVYCDHFII